MFQGPFLIGAFCASASLAGAAELDVPYEARQLANGLTVLVHEDHSDPVVAVYVSYHVGSAREELGRSGFAHLFEHVLFQGSKHVGDDMHFKYVSEAGGTLNGTTNRDRTLYFETLPASQLELALWLEADRMGFLLPAVTQQSLDNQRDVVRNERRQNYENRPYGQAGAALAAAMFPPEHPYSWLTIGSHEDLEAATLEDVHAFFRRWYGPNNAVLAVGGDVQADEVFALAEKYFGPIPRGPEVARPEPQPVVLVDEVRLVQEDDVQLPQLNMSWMGATLYGTDDATLDMLAMILAENRAAVLERALTIDQQLAQGVSASNDSSELAGTFDITVTAAPGVDLDLIEREVRAVIAKLARDGVDAEHLQRMKNRYEADFVRRLETVSRRTSALAEYATYLGEPGHFQADLQSHLAVTADDLRRAVQGYLVNAPAAVLSVVPAGRFELAASGRSAEQIALEASFDRAQRPSSAVSAEFHSPAIWHRELANGLAVHGTPYEELPFTTLSLALPGGHLHEPIEKLGVADLCAELMNEGTRELSTTEFADALDFLGADLSVFSGADDVVVSLSVLDKHLPAALELFADVVLEPRFDPADFERLRTQRLTAIDTRGENVRGIAARAWNRLMYGDTIEGAPASGTRATVEALTLEDVRAHHRAMLDAPNARLAIVSGHPPEELEALFEDFVERWPAAPSAARAASAEQVGEPQALAGRLFLVDKPGAAQSEVRIGHMSVSSLDPTWWPLSVLNFPLGGAFSSRINMNLREDKGYTYGARSSFAGGLRPAPFTASAGVQTAVTAESVRELLNELEKIGAGISADELAFAKSSLRQSEPRRYESARARLGLVDEAAQYGWPDDYVERRLAELERLSEADLDRLAAEAIRPADLRILVVGDKQQVLEKLETLELGPVTLLDIDGRPLIEPE